MSGMLCRFVSTRFDYNCSFLRIDGMEIDGKMSAFPDGIYRFCAVNSARFC